MYYPGELVFVILLIVFVIVGCLTGAAYYAATTEKTPPAPTEEAAVEGPSEQEAAPAPVPTPDPAELLNTSLESALVVVAEGVSVGSVQVPPGTVLQQVNPNQWRVHADGITELVSDESVQRLLREGWFARVNNQRFTAGFEEMSRSFSESFRAVSEDFSRVMRDMASSVDLTRTQERIRELEARQEAARARQREAMERLAQARAVRASLGEVLSNIAPRTPAVPQQPARPAKPTPKSAIDRLLEGDDPIDESSGVKPGS